MLDADLQRSSTSTLSCFPAAVDGNREESTALQLTENIPLAGRLEVHLFGVALVSALRFSGEPVKADTALGSSFPPEAPECHLALRLVVLLHNFITSFVFFAQRSQNEAGLWVVKHGS
ncbi:hypothetical protein AMELA_G00247080 [Ameiurus melas]|uniref:Uncharacterized protein n=1 Tax=Ameiurus melas TaxID=219545 RepID=A0A7J5ZV11_AMEME|nr:hypothetical protein AMELA_G00247080 [Ameiurus melas]